MENKIQIIKTKSDAKHVSIKSFDGQDTWLKNMLATYNCGKFSGGVSGGGTRFLSITDSKEFGKIKKLPDYIKRYKKAK